MVCVLFAGVCDGACIVVVLVIVCARVSAFGLLLLCCTGWFVGVCAFDYVGGGVVLCIECVVV